MRTRSGKVYNSEESNTDMDPNASSSGVTSLTDYIIPKILKALKKIKAQMNTLDQRMDRLEVEVMMEVIMKSVNSIIAKRREKNNCACVLVVVKSTT